MTFYGTIKINQEEEWYVATCPENNIASQGKIIEEAITLCYEDETTKQELNFLQVSQVYTARLEMTM